jgi:signal transduction histidine kinase
MSQVLPAPLAAKYNNLALGEGAYWFGLVCLAASVAGIGSIALAAPGFTGWAVFPALAIIGGGGTILYLQRSRSIPLLVLVVGVELLGLALYAHTVFVYQNSQPANPRSTSDTLFITLVTTAVLMFGVTAGRVLPGIASVIVAYVLATGTVVVLANVTHHEVVPDVTATGVFLVLVLVLSLLSVSRRRARAIEPDFVRADHDDSAAIMRERAANRVSALVHDTVLNELAVVSTRQAGPVPDNVRERIAASIADVMAENAQGSADVRPAERLGGAVAHAVDAARALGLVVTVEGDVASISALPPTVADALGLAVRQCLENVAAHAGTDVAEVAIIAGDGVLTAMVVDSGNGFQEHGVGPDRLGLRTSVRKRIEAIGGTVQVWTTQGVGTSVSMTVPLP